MSDNWDEEFEADDTVYTGKEVVRKLRSSIPRDFQASADLRVQWLWSQRLCVVQNIAVRGEDVMDVMCAKLMLSAVMMRHLPSIELVLQRLEGSAVTDEEVADSDGLKI